MKSKDPLLPNNIDHLVYTAPNLSTGMDEIELLLGIRPVPGGQHPDFGTHNALLSLGPTTYLEVMAPDPSLDTPKDNLLFQDCFWQGPRLTRWVIRSEEIDKLAYTASTGGLDLGEVQSGSRKNSDGRVLSWKLTDPRVMPLDGAVPFLISWGNNPHPARSAPLAGELVDFKIEHPKEAKVRKALELIDVKVRITKASKVRLLAVVKTVKGELVLF